MRGRFHIYLDSKKEKGKGCSKKQPAMFTGQDKPFGLARAQGVRWVRAKEKVRDQINQDPVSHARQLGSLLVNGEPLKVLSREVLWSDPYLLPKYHSGSQHGPQFKGNQTRGREASPTQQAPALPLARSHGASFQLTASPLYSGPVVATLQMKKPGLREADRLIPRVAKLSCGRWRFSNWVYLAPDLCSFHLSTQLSLFNTS